MAFNRQGQKVFRSLCYKVSDGVELQKRNQEKTKTKVWNFNDPLGWETFRMLTECESSVQVMWESLGNTEESCQLWKKQLNDIIHQCFAKENSEGQKTV